MEKDLNPLLEAFENEKTLRAEATEGPSTILEKYFNVSSLVDSLVVTLLDMDQFSTILTAVSL